MEIYTYTYGNIYIMRQFKWGVIIILPYFLSNGVGEHDKRSYLNPKSRTLEYLLSARLFTLASFGELVGTREKVIHCFCKVYFSKLHTCLKRHNDRLASKLQESYYCLPINPKPRYDKPSCKTKPGWNVSWCLSYEMYSKILISAR